MLPNPRTVREIQETLVVSHLGRESSDVGGVGSDGVEGGVVETQTGLHQCDLDISVKGPLNRLAGMIHDWIGTLTGMPQFATKEFLKKPLRGLASQGSRLAWGTVAQNTS